MFANGVRGSVRAPIDLRSRLLAGMSYLGVLCFVPLLMNKDDEFVYFHARQGLILWIWGVVALFALHLPGIGKWFFSFSALAVFVCSAIGLLAVGLNRAWKLPFLYDLSAKL